MLVSWHTVQLAAKDNVAYAQLLSTIAVRRRRHAYLLFLAGEAVPLFSQQPLHMAAIPSALHPFSIVCSLKRHSNSQNVIRALSLLLFAVTRPTEGWSINSERGGRHGTVCGRCFVGPCRAGVVQHAVVGMDIPSPSDSARLRYSR